MGAYCLPREAAFSHTREVAGPTQNVLSTETYHDAPRPARFCARSRTFLFGGEASLDRSAGFVHPPKLVAQHPPIFSQTAFVPFFTKDDTPCFLLFFSRQEGVPSRSPRFPASEMVFFFPRGWGFCSDIEVLFPYRLPFADSGLLSLSERVQVGFLLSSLAQSESSLFSASLPPYEFSTIE